MRMHRTTIIVYAALLVGPSLARADRRYYGETYNAVTAPRGSLDVELWSTYQAAPREAPAGSPYQLRQQLELETGITDRWDVALYGIARYVEGGSNEFEAAKVETRFAVSRPGEWPVDVVAYLEAKKTFLEEKPFSVEEKLIVGKDLGRLNLALNVAAEQEFESGEVKPEWSWALGSSWEILSVLRAGLEAFGSIAEEETAPGQEATETAVWAGPTLSIAYRRVWLVLAGGFGITDESDALRARAILAFQF